MTPRPLEWKGNPNPKPREKKAKEPKDEKVKTPKGGNDTKQAES
jgi:tryptophanyl-tRNA synthetase